jgi:nitroreductase
VDDERQRGWLWFDHGQATISMMIAAADRGIGTGHAAIDDQDLARQILGLPEDRLALGMFSLGHPRDRPLAPLRRPDRRPFDEVVHRGRW